MAKLYEVITTLGPQAFFNPDHIKLVEQPRERPNECLVHFVDGQSISIEQSAETFARRVSH
jgi:hypothetical protein